MSKQIQSENFTANENVAQEQKKLNILTYPFQKNKLKMAYSNGNQPFIESDLIPIYKVYQYPYYSIGLIISTFQGKFEPNLATVSYGTALLVASNVILTSASLVYNINNKKVAQKIEFFIGLNGDKQLSEKCFNVLKPFFYCQKYEKQNKTDDDFSFLILDRHVYKSIKPIQIIVDCPEINQFIGIYGYCQNRYYQDNHQLLMYGVVRSFPNQQDNLSVLTYDINTEGGLVGAGILIHLEYSFVAVIGVHCNDKSSKFGCKKQGCRLTKQKMELVNTWIKKKFPQQPLLPFYNLFQNKNINNLIQH